MISFHPVVVLWLWLAIRAGGHLRKPRKCCNRMCRVFLILLVCFCHSRCSGELLSGSQSS